MIFLMNYLNLWEQEWNIVSETVLCRDWLIYICVKKSPKINPPRNGGGGGKFNAEDTLRTAYSEFAGRSRSLYRPPE